MDGTMEETDRNMELQSLIYQEEEKHNDEYKPVNYLDKLKGFVAAGLWVSMVTVSATCCQLLERRIPDFELNTMRLVTNWILMVISLVAKRRLPKTDKFKLAIFFLHSICASGITLPYFIAVTLASVTSVQCLFLTSGITSGLFIFLVVVKEKITVKKMVCSLLCITGVILIIQPEFIFTGYATGKTTGIVQTENISLCDNGSTAYEEETFTSVNPIFTVLGLVLPIIAGTLLSSQTAMVKKFSFLAEDVVLTGFWSLLFSIILSAALVGIFENPTLPQNWMDGLYICGHSFSYVFIWTTSILTALYISGNTTNIITSTTVVLMLLPQYTVLSSIHPGHRNWVEVVGVVFVLLGSSLGSALELWSHK